MYYIYVLKNERNRDLYVGYTNDLKNRLFLHNSGKVHATKGYRPWILIYYEGYRDKFDATKRERQLKLHKAKEDLKKQIKLSLEI